MKRWSLGVFVAAVMLSAACTRSDEERAKAKGRQAGQELKHDLKQAGQEVKQGVKKAQRELDRATGEADRKRQ